jgi:hypothetical protein
MSGYDPEHGFETKDIPEQWQTLFKRVGIKKKDLQNYSTRWSRE